MSKFIFKILLLTGLILGAANYITYLTTGKSLFSNVSLPQLNIPNFTIPKISLPNLSLPKSPETASSNASPQPTYKWIDEKGLTHYSAEAPITSKPLTQTEILYIDPDTNLIQGTAALQPPEEEIQPTPKKLSAPPTQNDHNPATINKLINDAKNIQTLLNKRHEDNLN